MAAPAARTQPAAEGASRPSPDVHRNCSSVFNRHVCGRNVMAHQPAVSSYQRPSETDCFLVPELGHAPARATDSRRPGLIVRREHRTYFGTVKRMRAGVVQIPMEETAECSGVAGTFSAMGIEEVGCGVGLMQRWGKAG